MPHHGVSIATPDGTCDATLHTPGAAGSWPGVIMFPDAGGPRDTFRSMAQQLADLGYAVLLPNVYYRLGHIEPFDLRTVFTDRTERARLQALATSLTEEDVARDTKAMLDFLATRPEVAGTRIGTTGYCMGGSFALTAAGRFPERVAAAASFHGGQIASTAPDSPHLLAGSMRAKVYVAGAENDSSFDAEQFERLSTALTDADVDHILVTYPAAHGFAVPDNPTYDEGAAARHWQALEELYASTLAADSNHDLQLVLIDGHGVHVVGQPVHLGDSDVDGEAADENPRSGRWNPRSASTKARIRPSRSAARTTGSPGTRDVLRCHWSRISRPRARSHRRPVRNQVGTVPVPFTFTRPRGTSS